MTRTENLNLPQWEANDPIRREDFNEAMAALDTSLAASTPPKYISVDTSGKVSGDTIYTFAKAPRFVLLHGVYGTDLIRSGETITMLDYYTYNYHYLVDLQLSGTSLIMISRDDTTAISPLCMVVFY